jgi:transcriptional antiterminator NusG
MRFYVLRVATNKEDKVREGLVRKAKIEGLDLDGEKRVGRVLVPTERVRSMKGGVKKETDRKLYPGYVFVELETEADGRIPDKVWFMIKETDGVGDFIGSGGKPSPMTPKDQARMLEEAERPEEDVTLDVKFKKDDRVKVREGPFENFEGVVDEILADQGKVRIITSIFGRPTPLELEYWQIERADQ